MWSPPSIDQVAGNSNTIRRSCGDDDCHEPRGRSDSEPPANPPAAARRSRTVHVARLQNPGSDEASSARSALHAVERRLRADERQQADDHGNAQAGSQNEQIASTSDCPRRQHCAGCDYPRTQGDDHRDQLLARDDQRAAASIDAQGKPRLDHEVEEDRRGQDRTGPVDRASMTSGDPVYDPILERESMLRLTVYDLAADCGRHDDQIVRLKATGTRNMDAGPHTVPKLRP